MECLWSGEGIQLPRWHKKWRRLYHQDSYVIRLRPTHPNHIWTIGFVHDKLSNGRSYKMWMNTPMRPFAQRHDFQWLWTDASLPVLMKHGKSDFIHSDNGREFVALHYQYWLKGVGIQPMPIYPGSPWETGYNERFNRTLRREVLNAEWLHSKQSQVAINAQIRQYNQIRPHHALGMRPPVPETLSEKPK